MVVPVVQELQVIMVDSVAVVQVGFTAVTAAAAAVMQAAELMATIHLRTSAVAAVAVLSMQEPTKLTLQEFRPVTDL
jgi:hypothetical protein